MPTDDDGMPPAQAIAQMATAYQASYALRAMSVLNLADHLAVGPLTVEKLAVASGTQAPTLARLLRALAALNLCTFDEQGRVQLTPLGATLRSDAPESWQPWLRMMTSPLFTRALDELPTAIRTGEPSFPSVFGAPFWGYLATHPEDGAVFDAAMTGGSVTRAAALLATRDLASLGTLVDVGGGQGRLLAALLAAVPGLHGILADRPEVIAGAPAIFAAAGVADRCDVVATDLLVAVPDGGDVYVLSQIIHGWPDQQALAILRVCHRAMASGARLWLLEEVMPQGGRVEPGNAMFDLLMLTLVGGQQRTAAEYEALLAAAGFTAVAVVPTETDFCVVEAIRP